MSLETCSKCKGRKTFYTMGGGYSLVNMGGKLVDCPVCEGIGQVVPEIPEIKEEVEAIEEVKDPSNEEESSNIKKEEDAPVVSKKRGRPKKEKS